MNKHQYVDMSLLKNQNQLSHHLAKIFSLEELEDINIDNIRLYSSIRDISEVVNSIYKKEFKSGFTFELQDIFILNRYPVIRYVSIKISKMDYYNIEIKCKNSKKLISYISIAIARAIDYLKYKDKDDDKIIKEHIIDNFAQLLSEKCTVESLEELIFVNEYIINSEECFNSDYKFNFKLDGIDFFFYSSNHLIKFGFENTFIYFPKNKIGLNQSRIIVMKALKFKKTKTPVG